MRFELRSYVVRHVSVFVATVIVFPVYFLLLGMAAVTDGEGSILPICGAGSYITVEEVRSYCNVPGNCSQVLGCEHKAVFVIGYIRYINVWSKKKFPWIPYDKFFLYNSSGNANIEVRVSPEVADQVFSKIEMYGRDPGTPVYVTGRLIGVDLPVMDACHRDLVIDLIDADGLVYSSMLP